MGNNVEKALEIMQVHLDMRVKKMPIHEDEIIDSVKSGVMYLHGRDKKCRPCLVWRMEKMNGLNSDKVVQLVLFVLEFAIRYTMVPGRVENWVLIVDLQGVGLQHVNASNKVIAKHVTSLLSDVYCGRNFCTVILHTPWLVRTIVNSLIPADKKDKVYLLGDKEIESTLLGMFEPNQLEERYGGTAPSVSDETCYPFRFFPNATGLTKDWATPETPLHELVEHEFHAGNLWDESSENATHGWVGQAHKHCLTTASSKYIETKINGGIPACISMEQWYQVLQKNMNDRVRMSSIRTTLLGAEEDEFIIQTNIPGAKEMLQRATIARLERSAAQVNISQVHSSEIEAALGECMENQLHVNALETMTGNNSKLRGDALAGDESFDREPDTRVAFLAESVAETEEKLVTHHVVDYDSASACTNCWHLGFCRGNCTPRPARK